MKSPKFQRGDEVRFARGLRTIAGLSLHGLRGRVTSVECYRLNDVLQVQIVGGRHDGADFLICDYEIRRVKRVGAVA